MTDYPFTVGANGAFSSVFWHEKNDSEILIEGIMHPRIRVGIPGPAYKKTIAKIYVVPICDLIYEKCFVLEDPFKSKPIKVYHYFNDLIDELALFLGSIPVQAPNNQSIFVAKEFATFP